MAARRALLSLIRPVAPASSSSSSSFLRCSSTAAANGGWDHTSSRTAIESSSSAKCGGLMTTTTVGEERHRFLRKGSSRGFAAGSDAVSKAPEEPNMSLAVNEAIANPSADIVYDESEYQRLAPGGDMEKRAFTYLVLTGGRFIYASAVRLAVLKFLLSMSASKDVLALASLEVGLDSIEVGQTITVKWRGKPVFIRRRDADEIAAVRSVPMSELRDPQTDDERAKDPEWLVLVGVCTHLGCVPLPGAGDYGGWFCPCHGSHYDASGRIRKGPAPYNLEVPEHKFMEGNTLLIG